jgi:hypothetical protein
VSNNLLKYTGLYLLDLGRCFLVGTRDMTYLRNLVLAYDLRSHKDGNVVLPFPKDIVGSHKELDVSDLESGLFQCLSCSCLSK